MVYFSTSSITVGMWSDGALGILDMEAGNRRAGIWYISEYSLLYSTEFN